MIADQSQDVRSFNWLLTSFVDQSAGVCDAVAVSSDGLSSDTVLAFYQDREGSVWVATSALVAMRLRRPPGQPEPKG